MSRNRYFLTCIVATFFISCSPFCKYAGDTRNADLDGYKIAVNSKAGVQSKTFWDFRFATSTSEFRKLNTYKPALSDILFYAKTYEAPYEFYVLLNPKGQKRSPNFSYKDTIIGTSRIVVAISNDATDADRNFIFRNLRSTD